jgi:hypothetical protein
LQDRKSIRGRPNDDVAVIVEQPLRVHPQDLADLERLVFSLIEYDRRKAAKIDRIFQFRVVAITH